MKKYYAIGAAYNVNVCGVDKAQVYFTEKNIKDFLYDYFIFNTNEGSNYGKPINENLFLNGLCILEKAKITDVLSLKGLSGIGFLISKKLQLLIESCEIFGGEFFETEIQVQDDKIINDYLWFYLHSFGDEVIDFEKSVNSDVLPFVVKNEEDFIKARKLRPEIQRLLDEKYPFNNPEKEYARLAVRDSLQFQKYYLKKTVLGEYDLFSFKYDYKTYCSEYFYQKCMDNKITGLIFEEVDLSQKYIEI